MKLCKDCKHWNGGKGELICDICDPQFNNQWDGFTDEEQPDDSDETYNCD